MVIQPSDKKNIFSNLKNQGIIADKDTLTKYEHQGFMSEVYTINSSIGKLIIHVSNLIEEHRINQVWNKFSGLANILNSQFSYFAPKILDVDSNDGRMIMVQKYEEGKLAGKRIIEGIEIQDIWYLDKKEIISRVLKILGELHQNSRVEGFGWPVLKEKHLIGPFMTWREFLEKMTPEWIDSISKRDVELGLEMLSGLEESTRKHLAKADYQGNPVLVHGDAINPANLLVKENSDVFLLDWEWSIMADPAWEFGDVGWWTLLNEKDLSPYFQARNIISSEEQKDFIARSKNLGFFWLLYYMHAHDKNPQIYLSLRELLINRLHNTHTSLHQKMREAL